MILIFVSLAVVAVSLLLVYVKRKHSYWRRRGIPHDEPTFPHGSLGEFRRTKAMHEIMEDTYKKYKGQGPYAGFYAMLQPVIVPTDLDLIRQILIKDFNKFADRGTFFNEIDDPLTGNLFHMDGPKWRKLRHRLTPVFTSGKMKFMFNTVRTIVDELVSVLTEQLQQSADGVFEINELVARFTADVIGSCAFGIECSSLRNAEAEFVKVGRRAVTVRRHMGIIGIFAESFPKLARQLHLRLFTKETENFYTGIVKQTVKYREENNVKRNDFMDILLEMKNSVASDGENAITFNDILGQAFLFFIAGFDTSSTAMTMALYELAKNPAIQAAARDEIVEAFKRHNNELTYESIQEMKFVHRIISETLRRYPPLPIINRRCRETYQTDDPKYYIEKDTLVYIPSHAIHHDPEIYPEPYRFDPDRFLDEGVQNRHPCAWLPFGDGPRNCIGLRFGQMQASIGLAYLLKNFKFSVCELTKDRLEFNKFSRLLSFVDGVHLKVERI